MRYWKIHLLTDVKPKLQTSVKSIVTKLNLKKNNNAIPIDATKAKESSPSPTPCHQSKRHDMTCIKAYWRKCVNIVLVVAQLGHGRSIGLFLHTIID